MGRPEDGLVNGPAYIFEYYTTTDPGPFNYTGIISPSPLSLPKKLPNYLNLIARTMIYKA